MAARRVHTLLATHIFFYALVVVVFGLACGIRAFENNYNPQGERQHHRDGVFVPPLNADGYRTFIYNGRNNSYEHANFDPYHRSATRPPNPRPRHDDREERLQLPGVLGRWRTDIQGKERISSRNLDRDIFVETFSGRVQGFKVHLYDDPRAQHRPWSIPIERITKTVNVFLGIPYAMPLTKEGRFKPPRPHRGWQLMQAVDWKPACPQPKKYIGLEGIRDVHEDCLYLNIFSPNIDAGRAKPYSVMVYIHGGDFIHGASNLFPAHMLAAFYDVVVVSFNYRLGALGFLSTADENSPGNYGILDQAAALRWIYDNIKNFNGDPDSITLFGPGAGAASAGLLMTAPRTRDFVSKVIASSGSAVSDWALIIDKYRVQNTSKIYASKLGCPTESSWRLVQCLRENRNTEELGNAEFQPQVGFFPWAPVFDLNFTVPPDDLYDDWRASDWHFFTEKPEESIKNGNFRKDLSYMAGVVTQEASSILYNNDTLAAMNYEFTPTMFEQKIWELVLRYNYTLNLLGAYEAIKYMYTHWPDPKNTSVVRDQYINLLSDFLYVAPFDKMAKLLVEKNVPVYLYVLNTTIEAFNYPNWRRVPHNIEHFLLCGAPFMDIEFFPENFKFERDMWTDNDRNMSHFFMKAYSDFAKHGNPSLVHILGLHFELATQGQLRYLNINTTFNSSVQLNYRQTESAFWTNYLPTVVGRILPIYPPNLEYWWEFKQPLQIAFWSVSTVCLLLVVLSTVCCMLWRNAKRESDHYYSGDILMVRDDEPSEGIENINPASKENVYEYRDMPLRTRTTRQNETRLQERLAQNRKFSSTPSLRSNSNVSLKDIRSEGFISSSPNGHPKISKAASQTSLPKTKTHIIKGIPQTAV